MTEWEDVIEELVARLDKAVQDSNDLTFTGEDIVIEIALGGIDAVREWLLAQQEPTEEDSEVDEDVDPAIMTL